MDLWKAVQIVEGDIECLEHEWVEAWQWLIDEGHVCGSCRAGLVGMLWN